MTREEYLAELDAFLDGVRGLLDDGVLLARPAKLERSLGRLIRYRAALDPRPQAPPSPGPRVLDALRDLDRAVSVVRDRIREGV